ncbi:MAG: type II toxin-antitoxin system RelE/ParE family toxin [Proteobacteria bacterium]|nr:type II toxin-antitoxin system RelE/ParE family toxin [Pseudomonadota bacterium]
MVDLTNAVRWIARDNPRAARSLRRAVDRAAELIARHPDIGRLSPEVVRVPYRLFPVAGFPYVIVYEGDRRPPGIVRILHGARDLPEVLRDL